MEMLHAFFVAPFADMWEFPLFLIEVVINGLLTGVMYSLVALGFVLIFKASGVFNFAQGVMVLFAALTLVGLIERGTPVWLALILTMLVMIALAFAVERVVLRPMVNQEPIIMFMATIGLTFFLEGLGETLWGSNVKRLDVGIPSESFDFHGVLLNQFDLIAAAIGAVLVASLAIFFHKTPVGRALRAVADDHQAAMSVGIPLKTIWIIVWSVAGIVAMVAGIMWGAKSGVQFSLSLVAEIYWGPLVGGAIENWFAYVLALVFLLFRPQGLFGERIIERV
jgi:branched-chain amino acid transport system permease protein